MEALRSIWEGWLQFGVSDTSRLFYLFLDVLFVTVILFVVLRLFNAKRTVGYLSLIGLALALLVISAYITLPGLHTLVKFGLVVLVVGFPLFLDDKWLSLFSGEQNANRLPAQTQGYLNVPMSIIISLLGALLVVGLSTGISDKTAQLPQGITLSAVNLPDGMTATFGGNSKVDVIVAAPREKWAMLNSDSFSAIVDVSEQGEGTYDLPVKITSKIQDVRIIRSKPASVVVTVEPIIKKTVPVVAKFSGKAGNELVPDEPTFTPDKVEAQGPKSVMSDLTQAVVQVKLNGETQAIEQKFSLIALTSSGEVDESISFNPSEVDAKISLVKAGKLKSVGIRVVATGQPSGGYWVKSITTDPTVVTVTGAVDLLSELRDVPTEAISVAGLSASTTVSTTLALPSGVTIADNTSKISVKIELDQVSTTKSIHPELVYDGLSSSLKVTSVNPASITATVSGATSTLNALADSAVKVKLKLSAYKSAGTYSIKIENADFTFPDGVGLISFLPTAVDVILENR